MAEGFSGKACMRIWHENSGSWTPGKMEGSSGCDIGGTQAICDGNT